MENFKSARASQKSQETSDEFLYTPAEYTVLLELSNLELCPVNEVDETKIEEDVKKSQEPTKPSQDDISFLISWSNNVFKVQSSTTTTPTKSNQTTISAVKEFKFLSSAHEMISKVKNLPIFIKLLRGSTDLGLTEISFSECFSSSLGCKEFHAQTISAQCKFTSNEKTKAIVDVSLKLMRGVSVCKKEDAAKAEKVDDGGSETREESESDLSDFHCIAAADTLIHEESPYKVIDGRLVNLNSNVTGAIQCTDLFKAATCRCHEPSSNLRSTFAVICPKCGGKKTAKAKVKQNYVENSGVNSFNNWMDRNANEEDILNRLCVKHGVNMSDLRDEKCSSVQEKKKERISRKFENRCKKSAR